MNFDIDPITSKFYVEHTACTRHIGTLKEESDVRAYDIHNANPGKVMLCLSAGLDSQMALVSFLRQGIPVECSFLRLGGFNDNEYQNLKVLESKWGFKAHIIYIDPNQRREEIEHLKGILGVHGNHCIQHLFVKELPGDYDVVQVLHDPWIMTNPKSGVHYLYQSYYDPEIARHRALSAIERTGSIVMFGDSSEYLLSSINDDLFHNFLHSWIYYKQNGFRLSSNVPVPDILRYEYYIKPMLYAKHWKDELVYFPKFSGYENIDWLTKEVRSLRRERECYIPYHSLISHLQSGVGVHRFYQAPDPA